MVHARTPFHEGTRVVPMHPLFYLALMTLIQHYKLIANGTKPGLETHWMIVCGRNASSFLNRHLKPTCFISQMKEVSLSLC